MRRRRSTRLEASRTNHLTRSEELDHADWAGSNVTVTADAATAPDGTTTADNLSDTATGAHGFVSQAHTVADDSADRSASVHFAKTATDHIAMVALEYTGGTTELTYEAEINLNGGDTDVSNSPDAPTRVVVEDWGDFWRVSVVGANNGTGNTTATALAHPHVGTTLGTRDVSVTGDADAWGAQLEDGAFPSSYIATTTAAVTRAADDASESFASSPQEMTVYCKFVERGGVFVSDATRFSISRNAPRLFLLTDSNSVGNYRLFYQNDTDPLVDAVVTGEDPSIGDVVECRCVLNSDGSVTLGQSLNGGAEVTDSSGAPAAGISGDWLTGVIGIGAASNGDLPSFGDHIALTISSGVKTMDEMRSLAAGKASP